MPNAPSPNKPDERGTLADYLAADEIAPLALLADDDWDAIRRVTGRRLAWRFCTLRNLIAHRGRFAFDAMGFAWGGIYRTLLVSSIVTTSFRNEGHFRAGERIGGTSDFFSGGFVFPGSSPEFAEIIRMVNLRHHVAGVVTPTGEGRVRVRPDYEADYTYVATAFIESIRRGLGLCGVPPDSRAGRDLAGPLCTILYQLAGFTGLTRLPRDLAAHDRFRDAYDRRLREQPAVATVTTQEANRLEVFVIDADRFARLKEEPGFRAATAAEVQRRLALNSRLVGTLLEDTATRTGSPLLHSISQLFRFLSGDSHVPLDRVIGLPDDATPDECVEALRLQVDEATQAGGLPPDLEAYLANVVATIG